MRSCGSLSGVTKSCVVAIGNFDGVHVGHRSLLRHAKDGTDLPLVVLTFWPHPLTVLRPDKAPPLLGDLASRIELLREAGADEVRVIQFSPEIAALTPEEFIERFVLPLDPARVTVGENFRFGKGAAGCVADLQSRGAGIFDVQALDLAMVHDEITASTLIRKALEAGDVELAAEHLGRPFTFRGVVVVGDQRGRELGFPTANLPVDPEMAVPADGVYAGWLIDEDGTRHASAISVGSNPTFDGVDRRVEANVMGRDDLQLYGTEIEVEFVARLRGQVKFEGIPALVLQMQDDVRRAQGVLRSGETG